MAFLMTIEFDSGINSASQQIVVSLKFPIFRISWRYQVDRFKETEKKFENVTLYCFLKINTIDNVVIVNQTWLGWG
jgi:hypothetical protein